MHPIDPAGFLFIIFLLALLIAALMILSFHHPKEHAGPSPICPTCKGTRRVQLMYQGDLFEQPCPDCRK